MLAEVVEKLKKTEVQAASPAHCYAEPGDVECDFCTRTKHKAMKSSLMCRTSFCETHLKPHLELPTMKKHTLIEASSKLQERTEKQRELKKEQMKSQQRIQEKQKKVQELKQAVNMIKSRAQAAVEDSEIIFY
ncbi:tripartite motif-containing protein 16-like isoform X2 [Pangasianodon hypophthalmus]|uniref:tripartite motif-containing protein 16-like isoform X2 n=1 Tax=Pangasianodon hypophthalmus TaxID=310915 RepID=UPI00230756D5|nr:tripartite motif-containing protein 16-like isoform X2 [Pangasianodon hypophthalmus]